MIVFTLTNKVTGQVYVGTTRDTVEERWSELVLAATLPLDYPLYEEIRRHGAGDFDIREWAETDSREELATLELEALETFQAKSLRGYRTQTAAPVRNRPRVERDIELDEIE